MVLGGIAIVYAIGVGRGGPGVRRRPPVTFGSSNLTPYSCGGCGRALGMMGPAAPMVCGALLAAVGASARTRLARARDHTAGVGGEGRGGVDVPLGDEEETVETLMDTVRGAEAARETDLVGGRCEEVEGGGRGESGAEQGERAEDVEHAGGEVGLGTEDKGERGTGGGRGARGGERGGGVERDIGDKAGRDGRLSREHVGEGDGGREQGGSLREALRQRIP